MVDVRDLSPGMLVKIVDRWPESHDIHISQMKDLCGSIGEVVSVDTKSMFDEPVVILCTENPRQRWAYTGHMIDCVISSPNEPFAPAPEEDFLSLLIASPLGLRPQARVGGQPPCSGGS